jgi:hypothetical protein
MGWLNCNGIPDPKTRRFQELNGIQGRCMTRIGRAETDSQQVQLCKLCAFQKPLQAWLSPLNRQRLLR